MEVGKQVIARLEDLFFNVCELPKTLSALGVDDSKLEDMAQVASRGSVLHGFVDLSKDDIVNIYKMCL